MVPNDRLQAARVDASALPHDPNKLILSLVLRNDQVAWRVVLLVTHQDVRDKRALTRQESNRHLHRLSVPVLRVFALERLVLTFFLELMQKSVLGAHTEVAYGQETHFFENKLARQFELQGALT